MNLFNAIMRAHSALSPADRRSSGLGFNPSTDTLEGISAHAESWKEKGTYYGHVSWLWSVPEDKTHREVAREHLSATMISVIDRLVVVAGLAEVAGRLVEFDAPTGCWSDDGQTYEGHWSGTKEAMEEHLHRQLSAEEVTLLSLSRDFGPCPSLEEEGRTPLHTFLWPDGNSSGQWIDWALLAQRIEEYLG